MMRNVVIALYSMKALGSAYETGAPRRHGSR